MSVRLVGNLTPIGSKNKMDLELLKKVVAELAAVLSPARIDKIHQPAAGLLLFRLWNGRENLRLLVSAEPGSSRLHLTEAEYPNPAAPPRFCQLLRARLSRILTIQILNDDRIVALDCQGPKGETRLILELTGVEGNLLLVDADNRIIDLLVRKPELQGGRALRPGAIYTFPDKPASNRQAAELLVPLSESSINASVDAHYRRETDMRSNTDLRGNLQRVLRRQQKKLRRRLENIALEQSRQEQAEGYKQQAELLLANLSAVKPGAECLEVLNYYLEPAQMVIIRLDKRLNPQQNAEQYFKLYKKAKRGVEHSQRRAEETQAEIDWLDSLEFQLQETTAAVEVEAIAAECRQNGLLAQTKDRHAKKPPAAGSKPLEAQSPSGLKILLGRNNRQNDDLSTKSLKAGDLWFHVHRYPGAHVILKAAGGRQLGEDDRRYAAALAAGYSKAKDSSRVEVMQAEAGAVRKPKGSRPGLVRVSAYKIIVVQPQRLDG